MSGLDYCIKRMVMKQESGVGGVSDRVKVLWLGVLWVLLVGGCKEEVAAPEVADFPVKIEVDDADGRGVAAVPVSFGESIVGYTDKDGLFEAAVTLASGTIVEIGVGEIEDYHYVTETKKEAEFVVNNVNGELVATPFTFHASVESQKQNGWVWVYAKCVEPLAKEHCANLSIDVNGEVVAKTNAAGLAQFSLLQLPQTKNVLTIQTPTAADLLKQESEEDEGGDPVVFDPENPMVTFDLEHRPTLYFVEQSFTDTYAATHKKAKKKRARKSRKKSSRVGTKKGGGTKGKSTQGSGSKKKIESKGGVIDLF